MRHFKPGDLKEGCFEEITLTVDELEAMRLSFLENLSQNEAADCMNIHQSTFQRTLRRALEKVTEAFVYGKSVKIEGGNYSMPGRSGSGPGSGPEEGTGPGAGRCGAGKGRGGRGQSMNRGGGRGGPEACVCPQCGHEMPHTPGVPCTQVKCEKCGTSMIRK
ncbi:MAG: uncharacterized protein QG646_2490 [Euryarchaeota archaeon]|nr:uncharacterized protein [Euryarchaeota archaeon]